MGVTGAVLGSAIIYIIPSYIFLKSTARRVAEGALKATTKLRVERAWCQCLIGLGACLGVAGAYMSALNSFFPHLL